MCSWVYQQVSHHPPQSLYNPKPSHPHSCVPHAQTISIFPFLSHPTHPQPPSASASPQFLLYPSTAHHTSISSSSSVFFPTFSYPHPSLPTSHCRTPTRTHALYTFPFMLKDASL